MINSEMTVRDVAIQLPESTRLFESLKIDYCCGGNQPLGQACVSAGVDVDDVMEMLAGVGQSNEAKDFQNASLPELITHILDTHHVFTKSEMDRLQLLADKGAKLDVKNKNGQTPLALTSGAPAGQRGAAPARPSPALPPEPGRHPGAGRRR